MLNCKVSVSILLAAFRNAIACFPKHPNPPLPPPPEKASEKRAQKFYKKNLNVRIQFISMCIAARLRDPRVNLACEVA